jgi:hypothetical protein
MRPRTSLLLSILAAAGFLIGGRTQSRKIVALEQQYAALQKTAIGATEDDPASPRRSSDRQPRIDHTAEARAFLTQYHELRQSTEHQPGDTSGRDLILSLQYRPLEQLFLILQDGGPELIGFKDRIYERLSSEAPEKFLTLEFDPAEIQRANIYRRAALAKWAESNPDAAFDWWQRHQLEFEGYGARHLIQGATKRDPQQAFQIIEKLAPDEQSSAIGTAIKASSENLAAFLPAFRTHLEKETDPEKRKNLLQSATLELVREITYRPCDDVVKSLKQAGMSSEELTAFAKNLSHHDTLSNPGPWLDWMQEQLQGSDGVIYTGSMMRDWTQRDYRAADEWLRAAPDSPARQYAIMTHAEQLAAVDPTAALEWASSITDPKSRSDSYWQIHQNWPANDPEGKANFAKDHGFK